MLLFDDLMFGILWIVSPIWIQLFCRTQLLAPLIDHPNTDTWIHLITEIAFNDFITITDL